jgi:C4-dicarboxylate transporter, DctQ subunit
MDDMGVCGVCCARPCLRLHQGMQQRKRNEIVMTNLLMNCVRWLDKNAERVLILVAYSTMALIIVYAVFERFVFKTQIPWSSSIPIYLFLWVTWIGCSQNVRKRTHLVFNDLRLRMPYRAQYACLVLDALLWVVFGLVVLNFTIEQTMLVEMNFAIVQGTDNVMQWWFYLATPVAWSLLLLRVLQNLWDDTVRFKGNHPFLVDIQAIGQE